jgi:RimJ/RimL family protein N-acetyltransferase
LLEGENVNLRISEKDDYPILADWFNEPEVFGEYNPLHQVTVEEIGKLFSGPNEVKPFIVEDKTGKKVGFIVYFYMVHPACRLLEVGYSFVPSERGKGYGTEALGMMVDFLFLTKDASRIQALTDSRNLASQKILEKVGFKKEGALRRSMFIRGEWRDSWICSILREEWKNPKILKK